MAAPRTVHFPRALAFAALIGLAGCASQRAPDQAPTAAINEIWKEYSSSLNAGDMDRWMALWTEDGVQMPPDEPAVVGKERIRARNQAVADQFRLTSGSRTRRAARQGTGPLPEEHTRPV